MLSESICVNCFPQLIEIHAPISSPSCSTQPIPQPSFTSERTEMEQVQPDDKAPYRILLIEDNSNNRLLLTDYLTYFGYAVWSLPDSETLNTTLAVFQPDLILLDLKLPGMSGYEILQAIRQNPDWSMIPVIVVSALAFKADQQKAIDLGAQQFFVKPVNLLNLMQAIEAELGNRCFDNG